MASRNRQPLTAAQLEQMSPEQLAVRAGKAGEDARRCFGELIERFEPRLFNFLLRRLRSRHEAEDLTQEAFVRAWERICTYNPTWRFSTWLFTIATRLAITSHRRGRNHAGSAVVEVCATPDRAASTGMERGARLWALAATHLTDDQHNALWLRYVEDMAIEEIATVMDKSDVGVRVCLFRARQALAALCESGENESVRSWKAAAALAGGVA